MSDRTTYVFADWAGLDQPTFVGELTTSTLRGEDHYRFEYSESWLQEEGAVAIDPNLSLVIGNQFVPNNNPQFGVFLDSSPDRWGQTLMIRREAARAATQKRVPRTLKPIDFLLGVHDASRIGGLRFKYEFDGPFVDDDITMAAPPIKRLRALEEASRVYEKSGPDAKGLSAVRDLLAPGTSLGGARPKASVVDTDGHLWVAKFPSVTDQYDVAAFEYLVTQLAKECGITTPHCRIEKFASDHHTFLSKRFDRIDADTRVHMMSAMTMLGLHEGATDNTSYLDLAQAIEQHSGDTSAQLHELWQRIVFNVLISNTDDHLRNHSFLLASSGWSLSPAYDLNPNPSGTHLSLMINENDSRLSLDLVVEVAPLFRVDEQLATSTVKKMQTIVSTWEAKAAAIGIHRAEREMMRPAFSNAVQ